MMHPAIQTLRTLLFGLSFVMLTVATQAQTNVWIGPAVGDWSDPTNWSLGVVPNDPLSAPHLSGVHARIDANAGQDSSVSLDGGFIIGPLAVDAGDTLTIALNADLWTGPLVNSGSIYAIDEGISPSTGLKVTGLISNSPGGLISLDQAAFAAIGPVSNLLRNEGVVEGSGRISMSTIWNENLIDANVPGEELTIRPSFFSTSFINSGNLQASNGGTLRISDWDGGPIQNHDDGVLGTIEARGDSTVWIEGSNNRETNIYGGRIATSTDGGVEEGHVRLFGNISLVGVELDALASFTQFSLLRDSTFANLKTISIANNFILTIDGTTTVSGGGRIELSNAASVRTSGFGADVSVPKFVNVDNTISALPSSNVEFGAGLLVENHGMIEADGTDAILSLQVAGPNELPPGSAAWTNTGVIRATNGGRVVFRETAEKVFDNTGGVIEVDENSFLNFVGTHIRNGTIRGPASIPNSKFNYFGDGSLEDVRLEGVINWNHNDHLTFHGEIENTGLLTLDSEVLIGSEEVLLTGGGELVVPSVRRSFNTNTAVTLINVDNTLRIPNATRFEELTFVNRGTVEASEPNTNPILTFDSSASTGGPINSGVIRAIGGANLDMSQFFKTIQNFEIDEQGNTIAGIIQAGAGSEVLVDRVSGGILQAAAGGVVRIRGGGSLNLPSSLNNIAPVDMQLLGRIEADSLNIAGTIHNDGQFVVSGSINSGGNPNGIGRVRFLGSGELQLDGGLNVPNNSTFFNGPDHTIRGGGIINLSDNLFVNEGRIEANNENFLISANNSTNAQAYFRHEGELISSNNGRLTVGTGLDWSNEGLIESRDDGSELDLDFRGQLTNRGVIRVGETARMILDARTFGNDDQVVNAPGAELRIEGELNIRRARLVNEVGGKIAGGGQLNASGSSSPEDRLFINHGTLAPGHSVGRLTVFRDFEQTATGALEIELGGTSMNENEYDSLFAWNAELAGLLQVSLVDLGNGVFVPALGDTFEIITLSSNGLVTGQFDTLMLPALASDQAWGIQYNPTSVVLEILAPLQADLDNDGDVDGSDLLLIQRDDPSLISQWQTEYGSRVINSLAVSQAIPEPTSFALAILSLGLFLQRQRKP